MIHKNALLTDNIITWILRFNILISVITTISVFVVIGTETLAFFKHVSFFEFITGTRWEPLLDPRSFGIWPLICGSFIVVVGAMILALPSGIAVAVFFNEFSSPQLRRWIKPIVEILAGIPTVVYGYFALTFVTPLLRNFLPGIQVFNALSGTIVVAIMILPMISSMTDDAFRDVPRTLREGAYALGATRFETITQILIPATLSRIGAICILAMSRAVGETMAVTLAAGATPKMTLNPLESIQTLTAYIVQVSMGDVPAGGVEYLTVFSVGAVLFVITFFLNVIGYRLIRNAQMELG
ncbi:MAG: phosphate ABC transporter permease subunit PstC [Proteobacteria bacterium SG_bin7]|nr:MAG: phosphate ABC transporter permease subunit PstC [Proteobacteria bacterium SG_bin7]